MYSPTLVNEITKSPKIGAVKLMKFTVSNCSRGDEAMIKLFNILKIVIVSYLMTSHTGEQVIFRL